LGEDCENEIDQIIDEMLEMDLNDEVESLDDFTSQTESNFSFGKKKELKDHQNIPKEISNKLQEEQRVAKSKKVSILAKQR
jgi:hypothetical protein